MASITFDRVTKRFGDVVALNDMSLEVPDQEFLVLVGPSGCGKTTALRMLAGLETVTEGQIYIGDRLVNDVAAKDRDIAMVFQSYALYPHMSVYDNLAFGLSLRKTPKRDIDQRVRDAARILEIETLLDRKPGALSGGQRQRVALGRAIVREPAAFLMDEPLSNLDAKLRVQTRAELIRLHERLQTTVVYVTHDQVEAMTMGGRIVVLDAGVLQQVDTPQNLYKSPRNLFVAGFIGSPAMNFLQARVERSNGMLAVRIGEATVRLDRSQEANAADRIDQDVVFGIRPEHVLDAAEVGAADGALRVRVDVVEPLGSETFLHLVLQRAPEQGAFAARVSADFSSRPGEEIDVVFDVAKAHMFDKTTGEAIF